MPSYTYRCQQCVRDHEIRSSINERPENIICPDCGVDATRIFTPPALEFRGTGWGRG